MALVAYAFVGDVMILLADAALDGMPINLWINHNNYFVYNKDLELLDLNMNLVMKYNWNLSLIITG